MPISPLHSPFCKMTGIVPYNNLYTNLWLHCIWTVQPCRWATISTRCFKRIHWAQSFILLCSSPLLSKQALIRAAFNISLSPVYPTEVFPLGRGWPETLVSCSLSAFLRSSLFDFPLLIRVTSSSAVSPGQGTVLGTQKPVILRNTMFNNGNKMPLILFVN